MKKVFSYIIHKKGFFTKKIISWTMLFIALLTIDIITSLWNKMTITLLVVIFLFILMGIAARYVELRRDETTNEEPTEDMPVSEQEDDTVKTDTE